MCYLKEHGYMHKWINKELIILHIVHFMLEFV